MSMPQLSIQLGTGPRHCSWCIPRRTRVCSQDRGQRCGGQYSAPCQSDRFGRMPKEGGEASGEVVGCGDGWLAPVSECQCVRYSDLCLGNGSHWTQIICGSTKVHTAWRIEREVCGLVAVAITVDYQNIWCCVFCNIEVYLIFQVKLLSDICV